VEASRGEHWTRGGSGEAKIMNYLVKQYMSSRHDESHVIQTSLLATVGKKVA